MKALGPNGTMLWREAECWVAKAETHHTPFEAQYWDSHSQAFSHLYLELL